MGLLDDLFLSCDRSDAVHKKNQVYLDGEKEKLWDSNGKIDDIRRKEESENVSKLQIMQTAWVSEEEGRDV